MHPLTQDTWSRMVDIIETARNQLRKYDVKDIVMPLDPRKRRKLNYRGISEKMIEKNLAMPGRLIQVKDEGDGDFGRRWRLTFKQSKKTVIRIILEFGEEKIYIVTAYKP